MKKFFRLIKITLVFLFAVVLSLNLVVERAMATEQFSQSCDKDTLEINGTTLSASCQKSNGGSQQTSLNLEPYIGNLDGTLSWGERDFSKTCKNVGLAQLLSTKQLLLVADCKTAAVDTYTPTEIELDAHIVNRDGTLEYE